MEQVVAPFDVSDDIANNLAGVHVFLKHTTQIGRPLNRGMDSKPESVSPKIFYGFNPIPPGKGGGKDGN